VTGYLDRTKYSLKASDEGGTLHFYWFWCPAGRVPGLFLYFG
jgi:hypothetical protein